MKRIALIGSTGSIGRQALNVARRYPELFSIEAIVAFSSAKLLEEQMNEFHPKHAVIVNEDSAKQIHEIPSDVKFSVGKEQALSVCELPEVDTVLVAATGFAGLSYSLKAIEAGKALALANKETLVCGGQLVMPLAEEKNIDLTPIDSEHSALWQCLHFNTHGDFRRLLITASGGPFYHADQATLEKVTAKDALKHPTWTMGPKITIDSATLLNKGFEVIEAKWLYHTDLSKIEAVVHPESIIHSMVEFEDGAVLAQMSYPTMELPIQMSLTYPKRFPCDLKPLDLVKQGALHFLPLERKKFPCFDLALTSLEYGENYPCALNGAGEEAVHAFLRDEIKFTDIARVLEETLSKTKKEIVKDYATLAETDRRSRELAKEIICRF